MGKKDQSWFYKNHWCPKYDVCLASAAYTDTDFECNNCVNKSSQMDTFTLTESEINGAQRLLQAIFYPDRFQPKA